MLAGEGSEVTNFALVSIQGIPALWVESTMTTGTVKSGSGSIVIDLGDNLYVASLTSFEDQYMEDFLPFIDSIDIAGASGETDLSAALEEAGTPDGFVSQSLFTPSDTPAAVSADAIDATAADEIVLLDDDLCTVILKNFEIPEILYVLGAIISLALSLAATEQEL